MNALKPCMRLLRQAVGYLQGWRPASPGGSGSSAMLGDSPGSRLSGASVGTHSFESFAS